MVILLLPFSFVLESKKCIGGRPRGCCRVILEIIAFAIWLVSVLAKIINQELYKYNVCIICGGILFLYFHTGSSYIMNSNSAKRKDPIFTCVYYLKDHLHIYFLISA